MAAELECGVIDETGEYVGGEIDDERNLAAYRDLDAPPSGEPRGLGDRAVRSAATSKLTGPGVAKFGRSGWLSKQ